jgi:DNA-binding NtrC family response regulator
MNPRPKILLIEDDAGIAAALKKDLQTEGYEVAVATRGDEGNARAQNEPWDVVITDLKMPGLSGLDLVAQLHAAKPKLPIIMMTAFGTTETAIEATKLGAYDYLLKPFDMAEMLDAVAKAVATCPNPWTWAKFVPPNPLSSATAVPCRLSTRKSAGSPPQPSQC